ncbi:S49 family peptidase, partial [Lonsdalea populi]
AKSRNKTPQQVDEIAQGHVWIGRDAKANDLVDTLGDFDDAVKKAAELAKLDRHQLVWFEEDEGLIDALFNQVRSSVYAQFPDALQTLIPAPAAELSEMLRAQPSLSNKLTDPQHRYAMCLSCGNVR